MSDPYVYTPRVNYRNSPYLAPFYTQVNSPFIPNLSLSGSPFSPNISLPTAEPVQSRSPFIPFPSSSALDDEDYIQPYARPRTTSWTTGVVPDNILDDSWFRPRRPQRKRSRSAGYFDQPQVVNINNGYWVSPGTPYTPFTQLPATPYTPFNQLPAAPQIALHPYLDGQLPRGDVFFDLTAPAFSPMLRFGNNQFRLLTYDELNQAATQPPVYTMQIVSELIPMWPIDLVYNTLNRYSAVAPPLKVGDILSAIYKALHMRISQILWTQLSPQDVHAISAAYTTRCRSMGPMELTVRNDGVKRVDFFQGKRLFRGLTRTADPKVFQFHLSD